MIPSDQLQLTTEALEPVKSVVIALPEQPTLDSVAAGLALYLSLTAAGKQVSVFCPSQMTVRFSHLVGVDKIGNTIGGDQGKNLVISFPYQEGSIEKVSYNIEQETFNLVIEPREGYPMITADNIQFSYAGGGQPDLLIAIGISKLQDLQQILGNSASLVDTKPIITIDRDLAHEQYGKVNLVIPSASALCEISADLTTSLSLRMDADIATNLLAGLIDASDNFSSPNTTAQTFETAALLSRSGARKTPMTPPRSMPQHNPAPTRMPNPQSPRAPQPSFQQQYQQQPAPARMPHPQTAQHAGQMPQQQIPQRQQMPRPMPQQHQSPPRPQAHPQPAHQQNAHEPVRPPHGSPTHDTALSPGTPQSHDTDQSPHVGQQQQQETPADWLKPKIYKGSSLS